MITSTCQAPGCTNPVTQTSRRGRPTAYCSSACRPSSYKARRPRRITVEIDHEPTETGARPAGRVWSVQLSRGTRSIVVARGLGRPSADHLAGQLSELLGLSAESSALSRGGRSS
ncbi:MAG: hypothetical protein ACYDGN_18270 [Acidimicrobiales bacterium]